MKTPGKNLRKIFGVSDQYMQAYPPPGKQRLKDLFTGTE